MAKSQLQVLVTVVALCLVSAACGATGAYVLIDKPPGSGNREGSDVVVAARLECEIWHEVADRFVVFEGALCRSLAEDYSDLHPLTYALRLHVRSGDGSGVYSIKVPAHTEIAVGDTWPPMTTWDPRATPTPYTTSTPVGRD